MLNDAEIDDLIAEMETTLIHACDIKRPGAASTSGYNQQTPGALADHLLAEPCYYGAPAGGGQTVTELHEFTADQDVVLMALGTDVTEADVIQQVRDHAGAAIAGPLDVIHVMRRLTHLEITTRRHR